MGNIICTDKGSYDTTTVEGCYQYLSCELGLSSDKLAMLNLIYRNPRHTPDQIKELIDLLKEARLQIEYLHEKFQETGTGNAVIARIDKALEGLGVR